MTSLLNQLVKSAKTYPAVFLKSTFLPPTNCYIINRGYKHWNPKFKKLRGLKFIKVELPDMDLANKSPEEMTKEEVKKQMKEMGLSPTRIWNEKPVFICSTGGIFEPYVPPEGDGKVSVITTQGAKQKLEFIEKKSKSMMAVRKLRSFEEDFDVPDFLEEAKNIYINSYSAMINKDKDKLIQFITERAYPEVVSNIADKTIHWEFLESIEFPRLVHVRCTDVITKENVFCQITVRFHTKQKLAIYDRFGRLMHGSETLPKDVLEYVVFEKHLANKYGRWRVHDKIIPDWMPPREPLKRTFAMTPKPQVDPVEKAVTV